MLQQIYKTEIDYIKKFSQIYEDQEMIRFWDDKISDMYTHNFLLIKDNPGISKLKQIILDEMVLRKKKGLGFLRVEFNFSVDDEVFSDLPIVPEITRYDYLYIDAKMGEQLSGNPNSVIKKATSRQVLEDGIRVDILVNDSIMGEDFAKRRIHRKAEVYRDPDVQLHLYVCYHDDIPVGNCELMLNNDIAKIEDFDIIEDYQRKGFGTSVIKHLLEQAREENIQVVYLITDNQDTAKDMYRKCGFKKAGEKMELFFNLNQLEV